MLTVLRRLPKLKQSGVGASSRLGLSKRLGRFKAWRVRGVSRTKLKDGAHVCQQIAAKEKDAKRLAQTERRAERLNHRAARQLKRAEQIEAWKHEWAEWRRKRTALASARRIAREQERQRRHAEKVSSIQSHFQSMSGPQLIELCAGLHFVQSQDRPEQLVVDLLYAEVRRRGISQESIQLAILQIQQAALIESLDAVQKQNSKSRWGFGVGFGI
jgi:hypothetical protein